MLFRSALFHLHRMRWRIKQLNMKRKSFLWYVVAALGYLLCCCVVALLNHSHVVYLLYGASLMLFLLYCIRMAFIFFPDEDDVEENHYWAARRKERRRLVAHDLFLALLMVWSYYTVTFYCKHDPVFSVELLSWGIIVFVLVMLMTDLRLYIKWRKKQDDEILESISQNKEKKTEKANSK